MNVWSLIEWRSYRTAQAPACAWFRDWILSRQRVSDRLLSVELSAGTRGADCRCGREEDTASV